MPVVGRQPGLCLDGAHLLAAAGGHTAGVAGSSAGGREAVTARGTWNKTESAQRQGQGQGQADGGRSFGMAREGPR